MNKTRITIVGVTTIVVIAVVLTFFLWPGQPEKAEPPEIAMENETFMDLGITYLPISPGVAAYYGLEIESGALITEVVPGSPADGAGIQVGDVILSFNGASLETETPLLGMMMSCPAGNRIALEVWRENTVRSVRLLHAQR
ncbi:MAG: PDZ domain-containing protein [Chloroflexi bacterium]|nr:PDZ domain-containing protein [Chloroflexota bacterium]